MNNEHPPIWTSDDAYPKLREQFARYTEVQMATVEGLEGKKSTPKHELARHRKVRSEMLEVCLQHRIKDDESIGGCPRLREWMLQYYSTLITNRFKDASWFRSVGIHQEHKYSKLIVYCVEEPHNIIFIPLRCPFRILLKIGTPATEPTAAPTTQIEVEPEMPFIPTQTSSEARG